MLSTDAPEYLSPATSIIVQHRIGAKNAELIASKLEADGSHHDFLSIFAGGSKHPIEQEESLNCYRTKVRFDTKFPPEVNINGRNFFETR